MPFKYGLGRDIGTGEKWIGGVWLLETIKMDEDIGKKEMDGPINVGNEKGLRTKEWCEILSQENKKKKLCRMLLEVVKILGGEMGKEMMESSKKIY
jgi:Predicted nucleoside-diphosphate sugar epimerase